MSSPSAYPYQRRISLRWMDNDVYGHVNNVQYYSFFDTIINEYLILEAGLDTSTGEAVGFCAESHCSYAAPISYPGTVLAGMGVEHVGSSSVRYAIGLFDGEVDADGSQLLAEGWFVHVFVGRESQRPTPIPDRIRAKLEAIQR